MILEILLGELNLQNVGGMRRTEETLKPPEKQRACQSENCNTAVKLNAMTLSIIKSNGFNVFKIRQRPSKTGRRIMFTTKRKTLAPSCS